MGPYEESTSSESCFMSNDDVLSVHLIYQTGYENLDKSKVFRDTNIRHNWTLVVPSGKNKYVLVQHDLTLFDLTLPDQYNIPLPNPAESYFTPVLTKML